MFRLDARSISKGTLPRESAQKDKRPPETKLVAGAGSAPATSWGGVSREVKMVPRAGLEPAPPD